MKKLTTPLFATLLVLSVRLAAADPESAFGLAPSAAPQLAPAPPPAVPAAPSIPLIPDSLPSVEKPAKAAGQPAHDRTAVAEDKLKHRIELRQARNKAENAPDLQALRAKAYAAPTDFEQRALFVEYFTSLAERMGRIDPALKKEEIEELKSRYAGQYYQTRISPTVNPATFRTKQN
jgi:hypothetical protein